MADSADRPDVGRRTFSTSFRGFDQGEVRAYLGMLATQFTALNERIAALEAELEEARRPAERPAVDVASLTAALGEETGNVLRVARQTADELRARAEEGAARTLREAHEEATRIRGSAESVLAERSAEAEQVAARIRAAGEEDAARVRTQAETESQSKIAQAVATGKDMVGQAQAARERVLADLSRRRNSALHQIEALRGGRERLIASFTGARSEVDRLLDDLAQADAEARRAAEAIGRPKLAENVTSVSDTSLLPAPAELDEDLIVAEAVTDAPAEEMPADDAPAEEMPAGDAPAVEMPAGEVAADDMAPDEVAADVVAPDEVTADDTAPGEAAPDEAPTVDVTGVVERPAYPHDSIPTAVLSGPPVGEPAPGGRVDQLFARIRADRPAGAEPIAGVVVAEVAGPAPGPAAVAVADGDPRLDAPRTDVDEAYLQQRDALAESVHAKVAKAMKRALADDQNAALERLRKLRTPAVDLAALLDDESTQVHAWARRASTGLVDAAAAGARLGGGNPPADLAALSGIAERLATGSVQPLRERLAELIEAAGGDSEGAIVDRINAVFREARSRIAGLAGDAVTEALSAGFMAAVEPGTAVRWVVEDVDGPCPDCDDNALAGSTPTGEPFPTGQLAPPAHPGCRCILMRTNP
ncbi:MAG: DivIVA domain-containing protein [Acidimicrobiales bacterium]